MNGITTKILLAVMVCTLPFAGIGLLYLAQLSQLIGIVTPTEEHVYDYTGIENDSRSVTKNGGVIKNGAKHNGKK